MEEGDQNDILVYMSINQINAEFVLDICLFEEIFKTCLQC